MSNRGKEGRREGAELARRFVREIGREKGSSALLGRGFLMSIEVNLANLHVGPQWHLDLLLPYHQHHLNFVDLRKSHYQSDWH